MEPKNLVISKWINTIEFSTLWPNIHPRKHLHTGRIDINIFKETLLVTEPSGNNPNKKPALWQHVHSTEYIKNSLNFYLFVVLGIALGALFMQRRSSTIDPVPKLLFKVLYLVPWVKKEQLQNKSIYYLRWGLSRTSYGQIWLSTDSMELKMTLTFWSSSVLFLSSGITDGYCHV